MSVSNTKPDFRPILWFYAMLLGAGVLGWVLAKEEAMALEVFLVSMPYILICTAVMVSLGTRSKT